MKPSAALEWTTVAPGTFFVMHKGHRLVVQKAEIGSQRFWSFINGDPIGGSHATLEEAQRECLRLAQP